MLRRHEEETHELQREIEVLQNRIQAIHPQMSSGFERIQDWMHATGPVFRNETGILEEEISDVITSLSSDEGTSPILTHRSVDENNDGQSIENIFEKVFIWMRILNLSWSSTCIVLQNLGIISLWLSCCSG